MNSALIVRTGGIDWLSSKHAMAARFHLGSNPRLIVNANAWP
jgi:hypothetical protein